MGQNNSKVVVHVQLDAAYYYAGDTVTGAVVLHVEQPIAVKAVEAKITGVEKTKWVERRQGGNNSYDETYHGKHVIFKEKLPLKGPGTINAGDYQWPISFQLPANIPGTFHYTAEDHRAKASIEYKIKLLVDQEGMLKSDLKKTIRFDVLQRSKVQAPSGPLQLHADVPISAWCCINKGHIDMRVAADTDSYLPGEVININAQVDNKSSTEVTQVDMKLMQRLHLMGDSCLGTINKHISVMRVGTRQQAVNGSQGAAGLFSQYVGTLQLDRAVEATCMGKLIKSTYELEVTAKTGCCLSEASVRTPIFVNDPQPHAAPAVMQPPLGWAPMVYPTVNFQVPAPDGYASWQQQAVPVSGSRLQQDVQAAVSQKLGNQQQYVTPGQYPQQQQQQSTPYDQPPMQPQAGMAYSPPGY